MNMKTASGREKKSKREVRDFPCFCFSFPSSLTCSIHSLSFCFFIFSSHPFSYLVFPFFFVSLCLTLTLSNPFGLSVLLTPLSSLLSFHFFFVLSLTLLSRPPFLTPPPPSVFRCLPSSYFLLFLSSCLPFLSHFLPSIICFDWFSYSLFVWNQIRSLKRTWKGK